MTTPASKGIALISLFSALVVGITTLPFSAHAAKGSTFAVQGANIQSQSSTDFGSSSMLQSLQNLKADHANEVTLIIPLVQTSETSTDIHSTGNTPTDAALVTAIQEAHALGLSVTLKPHDEISDGAWRANIDPIDRTTWFNNYETVLKHYAQIAQANNVEQIVLGTELIDVSSATHNETNTANWDTLIAGIRSVYSGKLGYAANWGTGVADEMDQIQFWDKLDFIGVDMYYAYAGPSESVPQMESELQTWNQSDLTLLQQKFNKPVEFTESGYRSVQDANTQPFNWQIDGPVDLTDQANAYQALLSYWSTVPFINGISIWDWNSNPTYGGATNTDYTPQGKPAEAVLSSWYAGTAVAVPVGAAAIISVTPTVVATPATTTPGSAVSLSTNVVNAGNYDQTGLLIDTEIYDANGTKVFQNFVENQTVTVGQTVTITSSWTPLSLGMYTVKTGVFTGGWSSALAWNNAAGSISVQNQTVPVPTPTPAPVIGSLSATAASFSTAVSTPATITAQVINNGSAVSNALIDTEVYDTGGNKVFQNFSSSQNLPTGSTNSYQSIFTPIASGIYRIALGIFTNDWSHNYLWLNSAGTITVGDATPTPTPTPTPELVPAPPIATSTPPVATSTPPVATTTPPVTPPVPAPTPTPVPPPTPTPVPAPLPVTSTGIISPANVTARTGTEVDFGGNSFGHEEQVTIVANGQTISNAHADGGGNFSTGSISVPQTPGTYLYTFTGQNSGIIGTANVVVTP
jgi:hypothetical protein